jgi:hypothetical protein
MAWNEIDRMYRMHAGVRAPLSAPVKIGERIKVARLKHVSRSIDSMFSKRPYEALAMGVEWRSGGHNGQWHITEAHTTRRGNTVTRTHRGASTKIERFSDNTSDGIERMYGPERPPFVVGEAIRYSYRPHAQFWIPAVVERIEITSFLNEPRWSFVVRDSVSGKLTYIDFGRFNIELMSSKRHLPY